MQTGGCFVGRAWSTLAGGPILLGVVNGKAHDITSRRCPTVRDLLEFDDPADFVRHSVVEGAPAVATYAELLQRRLRGGSTQLLSPFDLQPIKACGVTFADSMIERVIEERVGGDPAAAQGIRARIGEAIGGNLRKIAPGSAEAESLRRALVAEGLWSQYLEVGIGPDAEIFTKVPVLSSVGSGADIGVLRASRWNNPEPEIVLAVDSRGRIKGATLGNDVNLRDVEGRSALLLGKAKDNNASCAIGPTIRLFDSTYSIDDVRVAEIEIVVEGVDGFVMRARSSLREISRDLEDLVSQTIGRNHQYPDGFALFLGTSFAPVDDRDTPGGGFTHKDGDIVTIGNCQLGTLWNRVRPCDECPEWTFGLADFMRNLARRGLI